LVALCLGGEVPGSHPRIVWTATYDGAAHGEDRLTGFVTDSAGNCWISGYSFGDTTDFDFATAKVGPDGRTVWSRRYGSSLKCEDRAWCLARDSTGNVIVAGGSIADVDAGWDFTLVKYDSTGEVVWLRGYDSPFHSDDKPGALAVGLDDCLYVAGSSKHKAVESGVGREPSSVKRSDTDVSLVKYSANGDRLWARFYNGRASLDDGAAAIAVDRAGNCYVAAKVTNRQPGTDIALLRYRADGTLAWSRQIDGPGQGPDFPAVVLLMDPTFADSTPNAGPRLSNLGLRASLCATPRVFVIGSTTGRGTSYDYYAICFDTTGIQLWEKTYDGSGRVDVASAACLDSAGNLFITGQSTGAASSFDIATVSYSPNGGQKWVRRYNGQRGGADRGSCIVAGRQNRVIVGGTSAGAAGFPDMVLLGYSVDGDSVWSFTHAGTGAGESKPVAILPAPVEPPPASTAPVGQCANRQSPVPGPQSPAVNRHPSFLVAGYDCNSSTGTDYVVMLLTEEE
jgi:hypothetical protein